MSDEGFIYDSTRCLACRSCQVACQTAHALAPDSFFRRVELRRLSAAGAAVDLPYSGGCAHCGESACVAACPTGAMYRAQDGFVLHNDDICVGCGVCSWVCPYGAVVLDSERGIARKCDSCHDRRAQGLLPACVAACPTQALQWGSLEEYRSAHPSAAPALPFLPDPAETLPRLCVLVNQEAVE